MSLTNPNRVAKGVPTGGQFAAGAKTESGVNLSDSATTPAFAAAARAGQPVEKPLGRGWKVLSTLVYGRGVRPDRFEKASLAGASGAAVGSAAMIGGSVAAAPAVAGIAGVVMVVGAATTLTSMIMQNRKMAGTR